MIQHHERLNGSGYPYGLKGEEILLPATMIAVADVVKAISSHRPYRPALGTEVAIEEITSGAGILYDRRLRGLESICWKMDSLSSRSWRGYRLDDISLHAKNGYSSSSYKRLIGPSDFKHLEDL